jgi:alkylation response protein AidB-like acyl-CoA dehydrogenase
MDFELTEEQKVIQKAARDFAQGEFDEDAILELQEKNGFPYGIYKRACQLGFIGISYPEAFGGQDYNLFENVLVIEEFCRKDSGVGIALSSADLGMELIVKFGSDGQKEKFLRPMTKGDTIASLVCPKPEEENQQHPSVLLTKENDRYILNGDESYILNGSLANFFIVQCRVNSGRLPSLPQDLFVVVEKGRDGLSIIDMGGKLGINMLPWNKLIFSGVEVSKDDILGIDHTEVDQLLGIQLIKMAKIGAQALGIAQGAFDRALVYSKQREQFGKKIGEFQGIRHKLVDMYMKIQATRFLIYYSASLYDAKKLDLCGATTAQLCAEMTAVDVTDEAVQIFGGAGYMLETPVEHFYRDARTLRTLSGQQLLQKDIIAQSIIGRIT